MQIATNQSVAGVREPIRQVTAISIPDRAAEFQFDAHSVMDDVTDPAPGLPMTTR